MSTIKQKIAQLELHVRQIAQSCGRTDPVILLAVSKKRSVEEIIEAVEAGCRHFGESYVQEALPKIEALASRNLVWHFIGPIQSNKAALIASHFDWVHSIDRAKVARKLNDNRPSHTGPLNVCVQVNISSEASKSGILYEHLDKLVDEVKNLPRLRLRGLMGIAAKTQDSQLLRDTFKRLRNTQDRLNSTGLALDTLSMGMTNDMEAAIMEGSTIIRVGTGIFGARV